MFATIVGPYPRLDGMAAEGALRLALTDQLEAGMGILADGLAEPDPDVVAAWRRADELARALATELELEPRPVKARMVGPWTASRPTADDDGRRRALEIAQDGNRQLLALFAAGAPLVQVEEDALVEIDADDVDGRALAAEALEWLMDGIEGHVSLSISGGDASGAGPEVCFAAPFSSHGFDLILGPDGWRVAAKAPRERGLVLGVADCRKTRRDDTPVSVWGARYGASLGGRGLDRIGLAPSAGLERLPLEAARQKLQGLAEAAAVAGLPKDELRRALPKRALSRGTPPGHLPVPPSEPSAADLEAATRDPSVDAGEPKEPA